MKCLHVLMIVCVLQPLLHADEQSVTQKALDEAAYADAETALLLVLDKNPTDDQARFGLGVVQFFAAVEGLGQAFYEYGAVSGHASQPFLRLAVPKNQDPAEISYRELGRVLDEFATKLRRAETTLAQISDESVKLELKLGTASFDFTRTGKNLSTLSDLVASMNTRLPKANPELEIHFDRGDVAWLRAYCHLLCAMVEGYGAVDCEDGFNERVGEVFPKMRTSKKPRPDWYQYITIADPPRLRRMRIHLAAVGALNRETWKYIRAETDDDFEWLPHPKQTDQLNLPMSDTQIDAWLRFMDNIEGLMTGERLISGSYLRSWDKEIPEGKGLSFRKLLDAPPRDLFNWKRINEEGFDEKYLDDEAGKELFDLSAAIGVLQFFSGPFGFARAARMN